MLFPTEGNPDVPDELNPHNGVCLPVDVRQGQGEGVVTEPG